MTAWRLGSGRSCADLAVEDEAVVEIGIDGPGFGVKLEDELACLAKDSERFRILATLSRSPIPRFEACRARSSAALAAFSRCSVEDGIGVVAPGKVCVAAESADDLWRFGVGSTGGVVTASNVRPIDLLAVAGGGSEEVELSELLNPAKRLVNSRASSGR